MKDIPGGILKGVPDFCTVHVISKSGKIASTRAASRPAPFVHPLRHQLMQPASTKFAPFEGSTPSAASARGEPITSSKFFYQVFVASCRNSITVLYRSLFRRSKTCL